MSQSITYVGDNPFVPGNASFGYMPDQLIAGQLQLVTQPIVVAAGTLQRGTVLGRQTDWSFVGTPGATNTGNGTVGSTSPGTGALQGNYVLTAMSPTTFSVTSPEGDVLPNATVGTAYSNQVDFTIAAGGTAFVAGDTFTLAVLNSVGNFVACVKTASDGSQTPAAVLVDYADASEGPVQTGAYFMGEFNANAMTIDASWRLQDIAAALATRGIFVKSAVVAATPVAP